MHDAPRPPLLQRMPPGWWMTISWFAVIAYIGGPLMPFAPGRPLWHQILLGVPVLIWAGLVAALSAALLRHWQRAADGAVHRVGVFSDRSGRCRRAGRAWCTAMALRRPAGSAPNWRS
jgi:hypothetical protein